MSALSDSPYIRPLALQCCSAATGLVRRGAKGSHLLNLDRLFLRHYFVHWHCHVLQNNFFDLLDYLVLDHAARILLSSITSITLFTFRMGTASNVPHVRCLTLAACMLNITATCTRYGRNMLKDTSYGIA